MFHPSSDNVDKLTPKKDVTNSDKLFFGDTDSSREKLGESAYFFDLPFPHFDYVDMDTLFLQDHFPDVEQLSSGTFTAAAENVSKIQGDSGCREIEDSMKTSKSTCKETPTEKNIERKKSSNKERHSKISTAQGTRDRRMRLSVEIARKFFALQDMLSFDKASKTIEWLLLQAKDEIGKVYSESVNFNHGAIAMSASSTTDQCELVSVNDEGNVTNVNGNSTKNKGRRRRKFASKPIARESRERARERARERTKMKMQNQRLKAMDLSNNSSIFEAGNEEVDAQSFCMNPSFEEILADVEEPSSTAGDTINQKWSPSSAFCYLEYTQEQ